MNEDLLADLPPPLEDEPSSLRKDIADELGDHLACAFHRELVKSADEQVAKDRVLERFGDPRRIARQLWWQAMWSRIMLQKISIGLQSVLAVVLVLLVALLRQMQMHQQQFTADAAQLRAQTSANQMMLAQLVEQLRDVDLPRRPRPPVDTSSSMGGMMGTAAAGGSGMGMSSMGGFSGVAMMPPGMGGGEGSGTAAPLPAGASTLSLVLTMEKEDGPPAEGCVVGVIDDADKPLSLSFGGPSSGYGAMPMGGGSAGMGMPGAYGGTPGGYTPLQTHSGVNGYPLNADAQGRIDAGRVDPGRYTAIIEFPNGWFTHHKIIVRPGERRVEKIACPKLAEKAFVTITAPPLPEDLRSQVARSDGGREAGTQIHAAMKRSPEVKGRVKWNLLSARRLELSFDPATGQLALVMESSAEDPSSSRERASFRDESPDERFLVLPTGRYELALAINRDVPVEQSLFRVDQLAALGNPTHGDGWKPALEFDVQHGQNTWTLDRAAELFEPARKKLAELKSPLPSDEKPAEAGAQVP